MSEAFESVRMKALKLAALASRGVGGEAETAQRKLTEHLSKHGLTLEMLSESARKERMLHCVVNPAQPVKDSALLNLGGQCLAYVLNEHKFKYRSRVLPIHGFGKKKSCYVIVADLTDLEFEDWVAFFQHYAPLFVSSRKDMRDALRMAFKGFIHKHHIFADPGDDIEEGKPLTLAQMQALIAAMQMAQGDKWERPAGRLEQGGFMLV